MAVIPKTDKNLEALDPQKQAREFEQQQKEVQREFNKRQRALRKSQVDEGANNGIGDEIAGLQQITMPAQITPPVSESAEALDPQKQARELEEQQKELQRDFNKRQRASRGGQDLNIPPPISTPLSRKGKPAKTATETASQPSADQATAPTADNKRSFRQRAKEGRERMEKVKALVEGPAAIEGKIQRLKTIYRIINSGSAVTLVGLIVTFLVMNTQLFLATLSPVAKIIKIPLPKLNWFEIAIIIFLDIILAVILLAIIFAIYMIISCTGGFLGIGKPIKCLWGFTF
ncbi:hypothetical protein KKF32_02165 [Patescibacteria group bacterium]|nr:hypothetical protein [Patescibacteria group bacterium]